VTLSACFAQESYILVFKVFAYMEREEECRIFYGRRTVWLHDVARFVGMCYSTTSSLTVAGRHLSCSSFESLQCRMHRTSPARLPYALCRHRCYPLSCLACVCCARRWEEYICLYNTTLLPYEQKFVLNPGYFVFRNIT